MKYIYDLYSGKIDAQQLADFGIQSGGGSNYFYSRLYLSLYYHSQLDDDVKAVAYINEAMESSYAKVAKDQDLMVTVGNVLQKKLSSNQYQKGEGDIQDRRKRALMSQAKRLHLDQMTYSQNELNAIDAIKALEKKTQPTISH